MKTLENYPECMSVICNIQGMRAIIDSSYDPIKDFQSLKDLEYDVLHKMQNILITEYNKSLKS